MSATYNITEKTGYTRARIFSSFEEASTFHSNCVVLDKAAAVAEAEAILNEKWIRAHYEIGPEKTHEDLSRGYKARFARASSRFSDKIDIDVPIINDGGNW
jgi:hypothetical protein